MNNFVTSDHHFGHANIIGYTNRPFADVTEMDNTMIERWNEVVRPRDTIYHLGDFTLANKDVAFQIIRQLHGKIKIVPGGHDYWLSKFHELPRSVAEYAQIPQDKLTVLPPIHSMKFQKQLVTLCHFPMRSWHGSFHGTVQLYGHWHSDDVPPLPNSLNVCCDLHNFYPIKLEDAIKLAKQS